MILICEPKESNSGGGADFLTQLKSSDFALQGFCLAVFFYFSEISKADF